MQAEERERALLALLDWYRALGIDAAAGCEPVDWLARGEVAPGATFELPRTGGQPTAPARLPPAVRPTPAASGVVSSSAPHAHAPRVAPRTAPPVPKPPQGPRAGSSGAQSTASALAASARTLPELGAALAAFDDCGLKATAKNLCFYRGAEKAHLMLVGEAPGREEDLAGKPFVGPAGQLLDRMLAAIGLTEADVHITNVVYWRPPGNRVPTPQETEACRPFLERQVELVAPDIVVLLGGAATKQVLATSDGIMRLRGQWREMRIGNHACRVIATLHPAYLLRTPAAKRLAWRDLLAVKSALAGKN